MNSLSFLDVSCSIKQNQIGTDMYRKETDRNQYLLTSSCYPVECTDNIPFSLALRIVRICSEIETRERRFLELKELLQEREYKTGMINSAIEKARKIPRFKAFCDYLQPKATQYFCYSKKTLENHGWYGAIHV